ncbi:O-antigen ligase family protein [Parapedobacter pyrenivorans]|uniref:O-antigen ligase family protein n=1 Tax=Parapedobacter pyrenivorans TaxID=1305674 RepID=UPI001668BE9E|nr:O-antigen ligase family protein [Parapedobacter pyrenivorans]
MKVPAVITLINKASLLAFFLNFLGFYCILLVFANLNLLEFSRYVTVPLRILIVSCLCMGFIKRQKYNVGGSTLLFLLFAVLYFLRILTDALLDRNLYISYQQVFFYFLTFGFIPFLAIRHTSFRVDALIAMREWFFVSAFAFSLLATLSYAKFIGQVGRLTSGVSTDDLISPLILSYCSALVLGVSMNLWLTTTRKKFREKMSLIVLMLLALTPFFLGASRGSIFAIALPIIFLVITNRKAVANLKVLFASLIALIFLVIISDYFGSNIFDRFLNMFSDSNSSSTAGERVLIWKQSLSQFYSNPIIGDRMELVGYNIYPHNIFIEVLQNLGVLGFVPFIGLIFIGIKECFLLFRNHREFCWIGVFFLQSLSQNMFSGAIYNASWFWFSLALVISVRLSLKTQKRYTTDELSTSM